MAIKYVFIPKSSTYVDTAVEPNESYEDGQIHEFNDQDAGELAAANRIIQAGRGIDSSHLFASGNPIGVSAGSAAAPSIYATQDVDTGIFFPAVAQLAVTIAGVTRATFAAAALTLATPLAMAGQQVRLDADGDSYIHSPTDGVIATVIEGAEAWRTTAAREVVIGATTASSARLTVLGAGAVVGLYGGGNSDTVPFAGSFDGGGNLASALYGWGFVNRATDGHLRLIYRSGTTTDQVALHIDRGTGNVGIGGITAPGCPLAVDGEVAAGTTGNHVYLGVAVTAGSREGVSLRHAADVGYLESAQAGVAYHPMVYDASVHKIFIAGSERIQVDNAGRLLVGKTSGAFTVDIAGTIRADAVDTHKIGDGTDTPAMTGVAPRLAVQGASFNTGFLVRRDGQAEIGMVASAVGEFGTWTNHDLVVKTNNAERLRVDTAGRFIVGATSAANIAEFHDTNAIVVARGTGGYGSFYAQGSGTNAAYLFLGNITSGERGRVFTTNSGELGLTASAGTSVTLKATTINISDLPTSSAGLAAGDLWNNSGVVNVVNAV